MLLPPFPYVIYFLHGPNADNFTGCLSPITTTTKHISVPASAGAAGPATAYTAATSAPTCSNLAIAPITSPTNYTKSAVNWRPFCNSESICEVVCSRKRSTTKSTGTTSSASTRSSSFSSIASRCSTKSGQFSHPQKFRDVVL